MKESTLLKMKNDIEVLNKTMNQLINDYVMTKNGNLVTYQLIQKMPGFSEALEELNKQNAEAAASGSDEPVTENDEPNNE